MNSLFYPTLEENINSLSPQNVSPARQAVLQPLIEYIRQKNDAHAPIRLNFICTHNARRSHFTQIWAQTLAAHYNIKNVWCYSGGSESTAMHPAVAKTLANQGFEISTLVMSQNPLYAIKFGRNEMPILGFSKIFSDAYNPQSYFMAVMVCEQAAQNCPFVAGAENKVAVSYEDPKIFDETALEAEKYLEKSKEIATELAFVMAAINA